MSGAPLANANIALKSFHGPRVDGDFGFENRSGSHLRSIRIVSYPQVGSMRRLVVMGEGCGAEDSWFPSRTTGSRLHLSYLVFSF